MQAEFNLPQGTYLLSHSVGCLPKRAEHSLAAHYLDSWKSAGGDAWGDWLGTVEAFNQQLALLIDADPRGLCPQVNLSSGLCKYLSALPIESARTHILMHESAFPSMGFVVQALTKLGYQISLIDKHLDPDDLQVWQTHLNEQVAAALITHVHSNTGTVSPVAEIIQLCRACGVKAMVDVAQSTGILPYSVRDWMPDLLLGSCVKWLCGGPGAGFIWVNSEHMDRLTPMDVGWFSHQQPFEFDIHHFQYAKDARRFWGGTPSVAPYALALGAIEQIAEIGVDNIFAHNRKLLIQVLEAASPHLAIAVDLARNGGTLCLSLPAQKAERLDQLLKAEDCHFDRRGNCLRLSFHIYNSEQQAAQVGRLFNQL